MKLRMYRDTYYYLGGLALLLSIIFFLIFSLNITDHSDSQRIKEIYFAGHISNAHKRVIDNFNELNANKYVVKVVNLSFEKFSTNERKELFARFLRSESDKIDVFSIDQVWVPRFAKWAEPLESFIPYQVREELVSYGLETCSFGNHLVAVPLFLDIAVLYYREDLIKKYLGTDVIKKLNTRPLSWEEFIKFGLKLRNEKKPYYIFQAKDYEGLMCNFIELIGSQGLTLYQNQKIQLSTPEAEKALQLLVDLVFKYKLTPENIVEFEENKSYDYFIKNDALFLRGWPNLGWHFNPDSLEKEKIQYLRKTYIPCFDPKKSVTVFGGWNLMVSKFSKNKEGSVEFIKYCLTEEAQRIMYEEGNFLPTLKKLYQNKVYVNKNPELKFYREYFKSGIHRPFLKNYTKVSGIITNYLNQAISNKISVKEALSKAELEISTHILLLQ